MPNYEKEARDLRIQNDLLKAEKADLIKRVEFLLAEIKGLQWEYLAMGPHCWGRGDTYELAFNRCKSHWPGSMFPKGEIRVIKGRNLKIDKLGRLTGRDAEEVAKIKVTWAEIKAEGRKANDN